MQKQLYIFEDAYYNRLFPLTYFRPVFDLRCGISTLREKLIRAFPGFAVTLLCRENIAPLVKEQNPLLPVNTINGDGIFINGSILLNSTLLEAITAGNDEIIFTRQNRIAAARLSAENLNTFMESIASRTTFDDLESVLKREIDVTLLTFPWEFVHENGNQINEDFNQLVSTPRNFDIEQYPGVHFLNTKAIFIGNGVKIKPGVVIDAENGPVYIDDDAIVLPQATITGPAYIGKKSTIKTGAKIYENTTIGPVCKIGGEVEGSIILGYSNKQHDGFLGHAYLGQWVNLGADTNNSDLKNNYSNIRVTIDGKEYNTGLKFVGVTIGDHAKTGINTMINTGTVIGVAANVFGAGFPPKYIPSFAWGGAEELVEYRLDKALEVAKIVMGRRRITMSDTEEEVFKAVFVATQHERNF